jgi:hypothetical protein
MGWYVLEIAVPVAWQISCSKKCQHSVKGSKSRE